ncbi:penicillin-binding transpeptidase domain-containing protein [Streptomyces sp. NPDC004647]|uniref:penicillin-binding transpeptidase domain-containing protein n=1 Tax=Streptomyces sp. NPDC004647 TaxID=3154671 RepID=UPI0033A9952D
MRHRRMPAAALTVGLLTGLASGCGSEEDEATKTARSFLSAWAAGDAKRAASFTDDPEEAETELARLGGELGVDKARLTPGERTDGQREGTAHVAFRAEFTLAGAGVWKYGSSAEVRESGGRWKVHFTPSVLHPELRKYTRLVRNRDLPRRAAILAADGSDLAPEQTVWAISIWPAQLKDPDRAYQVLDEAELGVDLDIRTLKSRVAAAKPDQSVPVVTLRDEVYRKVREKLLPVPGLQFRDARRALAVAAKPLIGGVGRATAETLRNAGPGAAAADEVGVTGLQYRYQKQLAGTATTSVRVFDQVEQEAGRVLFRSRGKPGRPVGTTLDPRTQRAADQALAGVKKNAALVALRPGTGEVLAVSNSPDSGENRAFTGRYAPGSTFKVVTAAALLQSGLSPKAAVPCPRTVGVDGQRFENQAEYELPTGTTFREDFAQSCNTGFIGLRDKLGKGTLTGAAGQFGIGGAWDVGAATFDGSVPEPAGENEKAAGMIGQGRVEASPLVMASVAATVKEGSFRQPVLVPDAAENKHRAAKELAPAVAEELRTLMGAVVTEGSGKALRGISGSPGAKTGTAEFGTGKPPGTHAWMIGFRGDLAFAVLLEDGGSGGKDAGPVAARFLRALG